MNQLARINQMRPISTGFGPDPQAVYPSNTDRRNIT